MGRQTNIGRWRPIVQGRRRRVFDEELDRILLSPQQDWGLARILYKRANGLLPTLGWKHRARANLLLALAQVSARERGLEPAGGARAVFENRGQGYVINSEPAFPELPANRTCGGHGGIDPIDPTETSAGSPHAGVP
jgi:hypothetical protein